MILNAKTMDKLTSMINDITPVSFQERLNRTAKVRKMMKINGIQAVILDSGSSLFYFTGIKWSASERLTAAVIPAEGEIAYVCPAFEKERLKEMILFGSSIYTWDENENPSKCISSILNDADINNGKIGIEGSARFFVYDGIKKEMPGYEYVNADTVIIPCRICKSDAEIALMQRANDITAEAFKTSISLLKEGMSQIEFHEISAAAHKAMGVQGSISIQFGISTAYPHGSKIPVFLKKGDVVLMDGGCRVEGYTSDISRTIIFGKASSRQSDIWELEKEAQAAGFAAAQTGNTCESVDAASRKVIEDFGFGPGYKLPGLPHRTGHGIGLDGHEWGNIVQGNKTVLTPGMCFSIEPNISILGEFGMRLEDCVYMKEDGPHYFTKPSPAIDHPFAE